MRRPIVAVVLALVAASMAGCGGSNDMAAPETTPAAESLPLDTTREAAPPLDGVSLRGDAISLDDFRGRPVLINVWSSW
jgi:hypothetical protein